MKQEKKDQSLIFGIYFVVLFTFFIWYRLLGQAFVGEGATYLVEPYASQLGGYLEIFKRYDVQALLFFRAFGNIARDNMRFYMGALLLGITLVSCGLFMWVREATKSALAGIISSMLFIANFVGSFEILAIGVYPYFIQRVPNFALALISLVFLSKFLSTRKKKYYLLSFLFYAMGAFLAHYTLLILPTLCLYVAIYVLFEEAFSIKRCFYGLIYILPFVVWSYFLYHIEPKLVRIEGLYQLINTTPQLLLNVLSKLTIMTFPQEVIMFLSNAIFGMSLGRVETFLEAIKNISYLVGALYTMVAFFVIFKYKKYRSFMLVVFFSIPISLIMALFLRESIIYETSSSRYLYFPSMVVSIFWGLIFYLMIRKNFIIKILISIFLIYYILFERKLIMRSFDEVQPKHDSIHSTISFLKTEYKNFPENSVVVFPKTNSSYHTQMYDRFYGGRGVSYAADTYDIPIVVSRMDSFSGDIICLEDRMGNITVRKEKYRSNNPTPCSI